MDADHWNESEWDDDDWDDDASEVVPCPGCGAEVLENAQQCPSCGESVSHPASHWFGKPWWWVVLGVLGITAVIWVSLP